MSKFWNQIAITPEWTTWVVKHAAKMAKQNQTDDIHSQYMNTKYKLYIYKAQCRWRKESWNELYIVLYIHLLVSRATTDKQISYIDKGLAVNAGS